MLVLSAVTTQLGRLFHMLTTLLVKQYLRKSYLNRVNSRTDEIDSICTWASTNNLNLNLKKSVET